MTQKALKAKYFRLGLKYFGMPYHLAVRYSQWVRGTFTASPSYFPCKMGGELISRTQHYCAECDEYYFVDRYLMPDGKIMVADDHFGDLYIEKIEKG